MDGGGKAAGGGKGELAVDGAGRWLLSCTSPLASGMSSSIAPPLKQLLLPGLFNSQCSVSVPVCLAENVASCSTAL
jgi:hypothetical protein